MSCMKMFLVSAKDMESIRGCLVGLITEVLHRMLAVAHMQPITFGRSAGRTMMEPFFPSTLPLRERSLV